MLLGVSDLHHRREGITLQYIIHAVVVLDWIFLTLVDAVSHGYLAID